MGVILSVATSADGYIDDNNKDRLILSTPEDWADIYRLRAGADAILIGAETLRRDNPRLTLKGDELRAARLAAGKPAEPCKVIVSRKGYISPDHRIFEEPTSRIILFTESYRPQLEGLAEMIIEADITANFIITQLEKRGLFNIFVEGGAEIHNLFLSEKCATELRIATNPTICVGDPSAPHFRRPESLSKIEPNISFLGGMRVEQYRLQQPVSEQDILYMERAIEISRNCCPSQSSYCVGAVIITSTGEIFEGYTHETSPTHHAEQEAVKKALQAGADLRGATIYSSMEPCSQRSSEPESCSAIIIRHRFARALFALYEPSCFVCCNGALNMRNTGVEVHCIDHLGAKVLDVNSHLEL
ncbi:MAG: dihydrofolate reductase family protein [Rikenellaceae bacterium]